MGSFVPHQRACYHCTNCRGGHRPADDAFGLRASDPTPGAEQLAVLVGTTASLAEAAERLPPGAGGLRLAESTIERATEAAGDRPGRAPADGETLGVTADWAWPADAAGQAVAYVSIDATGLPIQGERVAPGPTAGWPGAARSYPPGPRPTRRPGGQSRGGPATWPGSGAWDELARPLRRQAARVGLVRAERWVARSDCGGGADDLLRMNFPRAVRIADFNHVAEHRGDLAMAWHPDDLDAARGRCSLSPAGLLQGGCRPVECILGWFDRRMPQPSTIRKTLSPASGR